MIESKVIELPPRQYMLYIDKEHPQHEFNYTRIEVDEETTEDVTGTVVDVFGGDKAPDKTIIGQSVTIKKKEDGVSTLGYLSGEHLDYLRQLPREFADNKYGIRQPKHLVTMALFAGFYQTVSSLVIHDRIVSNEMIERVFDTKTHVEPMYVVIKKHGEPWLLAFPDNAFYGKGDHITQEPITSLEALATYGIYALDEVHEKTVAGISEGHNWTVENE